MPLRFGPYRRDEEPTRGRRPPPDYTSGAAKYRVFVLVALVMFVLYIMFEARNPKHYEWLWKLDQGPGDPAAESRETNPLEIQPTSRSRPAIPIEAVNIPGAHRATEPQAEDSQPESPGQDDEEQLARARKDGWERLFDHFPPEEREQQHDLLFALLRAGRCDAPPSADERERMTKLLVQLDKAWGAFRAEAIVSLANLPEDDKARWLAVINTLEADWTTLTLPALKSVADGTPLGESDRATLARLQTLLDELALAAVRDDTIPNRPAERFAWFRLFETLGGADPAELHQLSHGTVGYVQLLKQPKDYRGKLVTVRGTIELGYRVPAFENVEGIEQYYIFWVRPAGGDDSPIVVYALETPQGFPEVLDKNVEDQAKNRLNVDVEFDAYLFKRMAYLSKKGTLTTPLLLARAPTLLHAPAQVAAQPRAKPPAYGTLALVLAGTAGFGLAVAVFAYFTTRRPRRRAEPHAEPTPEELRQLAWLESGPREEQKSPLV
jgi:hypothetical protein